MKRPVLVRCSMGSVTGTVDTNILMIFKYENVNTHIFKIITVKTHFMRIYKAHTQVL